MPRRKNVRSPRLVDRDYEILHHLARYRMTTREVLHKLFFPGSQLNAVTKVTSRLTKDGFLNRWDLTTGKSYYVIGPEGLRILGVSKNYSYALGPQALPKRYAILFFCCLTEPLKECLTVSELKLRYSNLLQRKVECSSYYLDKDQTGMTRLAFMRVDLGGTPAHIISKCQTDIEVRNQYQDYQQLIDGDRFMITILTTESSKAERIKEAILTRDWTIRLRVEVIPELATLITRSL